MSDARMAENLFQFREGFPLGQVQGEQGEQLVEVVVTMSAYNRGILYVEAENATLGAEMAFKCDGLLPVVTDYLNHVLAPAVDWRFKSGLEKELVRQYMDAADGETPWSLREISDAVSRAANRPALANVADEQGLTSARTCVREQSGVPLSVTLLMVDLGLEHMHEMSQQYQLNLMGDPVPDTLDLTPTLQYLANMEVDPRATIPQDLKAKALQRNAPDEPTTDHSPNTQER